MAGGTLIGGLLASGPLKYMTGDMAGDLCSDGSAALDVLPWHVKVEIFYMLESL